MFTKKRHADSPYKQLPVASFTFCSAHVLVLVASNKQVGEVERELLVPSYSRWLALAGLLSLVAWTVMRAFILVYVALCLTVFGVDSNDYYMYR